MESLKKKQQILWSSDRSTKETQSISDRSSNGIDNVVNVRVILRCRPMSEEETRLSTPVAISCNENKPEVFVIRNMFNQKIDKSFVFDGVFGPKSLQKDFFEQVVVPFINEALEGYTCTILAYGQSGTGKTYTMEGEGNIHKDEAFVDGLGLIPRTVKQIFDVLESQKTIYTVKVTYLELYNEEIIDLLVDENSISFEENRKKLITLMENGKGNVYLKGLKEIEVKNSAEVYKILNQGSIKKHTTNTFFNEKSNRSHSIFSISIHTKDCFQDGVELLKCGKLNFVDLAGSENILKSGAREERARGAGKINKSLLTLGRVINALVEHSNHVPYRDSKLTRLLRDSLGGKTKTCLIATISPSTRCLDETINTIEYAYRAKNIKNKPEVNQKVLKSVLVNNLYAEIDHLKKDLHATREKNGIYIPQDEYMNEQAAKMAMLKKIEEIELDLQSKDEKVKEIQEFCANQQKLSSELSEKNEKTQRDFERTAKALAELEEKYRKANQIIQEKEYLIYNLLGSEKGLTETAFELRAELENASTEVSTLLQDIDNKNKKEGANKIVIQNFRAQLVTQLQSLHKIVSDSVTKQEQQLKSIDEDAKLFSSEKSEATDQLKARKEELKVIYDSNLKKSEDLVEEINENLHLAYESLEKEIPSRSKSVMDSFRNFASEADVVIHDLKNNLVRQNEKISMFVKQQQEAHSRALRKIQSISIAVMDFIHGLNAHISKLEFLAEESFTMDKELCALEKKLEDFAANEEKQLLDKISEILATSNARKRIMEKQSIDSLKTSISEKSKKLNREMTSMKIFTTSIEQKMENLFSKMGAQYIEDSTIVDVIKDELDECLKHCKEDAEKLSEQWTDAEQSLLCLHRTNLDFVDSVITKGIEANQMSRARASSIALSTINKINATTDSFRSSLEYIKALDGSKKCSSSVARSCKDLRQMETNHARGTNKIIQNSEKILIHVDEPSCVEPKKSSFCLPSIEAIEDLNTPPLEDLLNTFREDKYLDQVNNGVNESIE